MLEQIPLPPTVWLIYYSILFVILIVSIVHIRRRKLLWLSRIALTLTIFVPILSMVNSLFLFPELNEYQHIRNELAAGALWSQLAVAGYSYLLLYIILIAIRKGRALL